MELIKNFNVSVANMRTITLTALAAVVVSNIFWQVRYERMVEVLTQRTYVAMDNGTLQAVAAQNPRPTIYEVKPMLENFTQFMFAYDAGNYRDRVNQGLKYMSKDKGLTLYKWLQGKDIFDNLTQFRCRTGFVVDSVRIDMTHTPYIGRVYGAWQWVYPNEVATQPLALRFQLEEQGRSFDNGYGVQINDFEFIEYNRDPED